MSMPRIYPCGVWARTATLILVPPTEISCRPDRFTIKTQEAIAAAGRLAEERRNPQVTPEHLLAVLLEQDGGIVPPSCASSASAPRPSARR